MKVPMGRNQPRCISGHIKEDRGYLSWLEGIDVSHEGRGAILICSFFRVALSGGESIPMKIKCALNWFESRANIQMNNLGVEVRDY